MRYLAALLFVLSLAGCVTITPEQERLAGLYLADKDAPPLAREPKSQSLAAGLSLLLPGLGHFYIGEPLWGLAWLPIGMVSPLAAPLAAWHDAATLRRIEMAETYRWFLMGIDVNDKAKKFIQNHSVGSKSRGDQKKDAGRTIFYCGRCGGELPREPGGCPRCDRSGK